MKTTRRQIVNVGAASLVSAGALGTTLTDTLAQAETPTPLPQTAGAETTAQTLVLRPDIDQIAAQETALDGQTGVAVHSVKLQAVNDILLYEVELSNGAEVTVDATTGQVMPLTEQSSDDSNDDDEDTDDEEDEED